LSSASDSDAAETATIANWRSSPFNRWAFRNVPKIIATDRIENDPTNIWALASNPKPFEDFKLTRADGSTLDLPAFLHATSTDAIVILQDGHIVYEAYANGNSEHAPHILMSATKSVVGLICGILRRTGDLDVDALVSDYVPEIALTAYQGATVRNLLDMRTGIVLDEAQIAAYTAASNWDPVTPDGANANFHDFFENLSAPYNPHGGPFKYISGNTDLLGWVIERATGRPFASLASTLFWKPLGAGDAALITLDRKGAPRCTGGFCSTVRDFARIGQLVLQSGHRDSTSIVPADWIADMENGGDHDAWANGEWGRLFSFAGKSMRYRSGWYVIDDEPKTLFAMGIHGQNLFVDRTNRIVIAKMSSQDNRIEYPAVLLTHKAVAEFRRCLLASQR
jgi:CubicO group peptidase (beta-lactamase class C family)